MDKITTGFPVVRRASQASTESTVTKTGVFSSGSLTDTDASDSVHGQDDTKFGFYFHSPTHLAVLISNLHFDIPVCAFLEPSAPDTFESQLISAYPSITAENKAAAERIIIRLLRAHYASHLPAFGAVPFIYTTPTGALAVREELDPRLIPHLHNPLPLYSGLPQIPRDQLRILPATPSSPKSWSSQIRLCTTPGDSTPQIAKGPSNTASFTELHTLLSLPPAPAIFPRPTALITVSSDDPRVCGFLLPYSPHGNLDHRATRLHAQGRLTEKKLAGWTAQLVRALRWLHHDAGSFHGDLKPDNIIISAINGGREDLMLIDFSQDDYTAATAAPEVIAGLHAAQLPTGEIVYTQPAQEKKHAAKPKARVRDWPQRAREAAEVWSLGRTVNILANGAGMTELYMRLYEDMGYEYRTEWRERCRGRYGRWVRRLVERCVEPDPRKRATFDELERMVEELEGGRMGMMCGMRKGCVIS